MKTSLWLVAVAEAAALLASPSAPPYAITNARIVVSPERTIPNGVIVMRDGLIQAVGEGLAVPADARIYDAKGLTLYPGLIDGCTHYGFPAPGAPGGRPGAAPPPVVTGFPSPPAVPDDVNSPERYIDPKPAGVHPDVKAAERMTPARQPDPRRSLGFATVLAVPREGNWQGVSALVNLAGESAPEVVVRAEVAMHVAFGTQGFRTYPSSLMGVMAVLRQSLLRAQQYQEAVELYDQAGGKGLPRPQFNPVSAALEPVIDGKLPVVLAASSAEEIRRVLRFADEFRLRPIIYGGAEAWRVADVLKARNVAVLVDLALEPPGSGGFFSTPRRGQDEPANSPKRVAAEENPGRLEKAGVKFALVSAGVERPEEIPAKLRRAIARGLSKSGALRAVTIAPAEILGAGNQLGTIETGKIANLALLDGEAFERKTQMKAVVIDGRFYFPAPAPPEAGPGRMTAREEGPPPAAAPDRTPPEAEPATWDLVVANATILTVTNGTIEGGSIWIHEGKIKAVGKAVNAPPDTKKIDGSGRYVMPGIIDSHSHSAISGGVNESAPAISPQCRITDVLDPEDIDIYRELAGGTTTLNVLHGSANAIGGQNAVIKLKWGRPVEEMLFPGAPPGIKFALGENPKRSNFATPVGATPRFPATRMGVESVIRESFIRAREYAKAWEDYRARKARGEKVLEPERNLALDELADVLAGKVLVHAHCYRADEISMLLDLADEFGFKIRSLQHVLEGYKVADKIRRHGAGASTFADEWGYKMEAFDGTPFNAALMAKAGIHTAVNSDSDERARRLYQEAAKTMKYGGLSETQALRMITIDPAWMLGIESRVGSIEAGKDGDLAIFNGHPFSPYARVEMTIIDGQVFFDRERDLQKRVPWKEEYEPEPLRRPGAPGAARPTDDRQEAER